MTRCVLAFDTSTELTCVAVTRAGQLLAEASTVSADRHAQTLLPRVEHCLQQAGLRVSDLDLFVVGVGPGSFTGVRVGLATAKGFALATGKPLRGVSSLPLLARPAASPGSLVAPLLDAHKGEVFAALYEPDPAGALQVLLPAFNATPALAAQRLLLAAAGRPVRVLGAGLRRYLAELQPVLDAASTELLDPSFDVPSASELAAQGLASFEAQGPSDLVHLLPLYLRGSDAQLPKAPLRL
ncbi:MAG TPA: tRNA (adenosine(37)-N6)-threonylcarbamoyltransferase complex dimerization subunit type 1 TsaB [Polyangiales bacterium]